MFTVFTMPRKVVETSVKFKQFQTRYKEWCKGKKGWQALCYDKWARIKGDDTLLRGFYSQMKLDITAEEANQKRQLEKRRMMFGLPKNRSQKSKSWRMKLYRPLLNLRKISTINRRHPDYHQYQKRLSWDQLPRQSQKVTILDQE